MSFSTLPTGLQNIYLTNFSFFAKMLLIAVFVGGCYLYQKNFKPKKESPYLFVRALRGIYYLMSLIGLVLSPLFILFLAPGVSLDSLVQLMVGFYTINLAVLMFVIPANILFHGSNFFFDLAKGSQEKSLVFKEARRILGENEFKKLEKGYFNK